VRTVKRVSSVKRLLKQISRLKVRAAPLIAERNRIEKIWREKVVPRLAEEHLLRVILVYRYGKPRIDEPLARAHKRGLLKLGVDEGAAVNEMRRILKEESARGKYQVPYVAVTAESIRRLRAQNDIKPQISKWVGQMPDWLRHLCVADISMVVLGLQPPKSALDVLKLWPTDSDFSAWPLLPQGKLEPLPEHLWLPVLHHQKRLLEKR